MIFAIVNFYARGECRVIGEKRVYERQRCQNILHCLVALNTDCLARIVAERQPNERDVVLSREMPCV